MKPFTQLMLFATLLLSAVNLFAQSSIGGYNVYYGHLHNHCSISDGTGTPGAAYNYAKTTGGLDFFSLADHSGSISGDEWITMKNAADSYNEDGIFTAFWGFEWSDTYRGHVAVINSENYITTASPYNTFEGLCNWLNNNECVAFFNHPGRQNSTGIEFSHFSSTPTDKFVGMELWNKSDKFNIYYYTDGYYTNDGNKSWYDEALARGWKIGASGSEDNHSGTWGTMTPSKMAVLAPANNRTEIMNALKARRFFTTYDKNLALSFKINGQEMGATIPGASSQVQIQASDGNGEVFSQVQLLKNGTVTNTWTPNSSTVNINLTITCSDGDYYYARVKQADSDEAVTSPIFISGGESNQSPVVSINSPADNTMADATGGITITALATDPDGNVVKVEFFQGTTLIGEDNTSPWSYTWTNPPAGTYQITARATDNSGAFTISAPVNCILYYPGQPLTVSATVASGMEDVEEAESGFIYTSSTDIELAYDSYNSYGNQKIGLRFTGLAIPQGAVITGAYVQFTCDEATSGACSLVIKGEASDNSPSFTASNFNISIRPTTSASVVWVPSDWNTVGEAGVNQRTPDLSAIIGEIINRPEYNLSNAISLIITGSGTRTAMAFEGLPAAAARLIITYTYGSIIPQPIIGTYSKRISASADDAEQYASGTVITNSTALEMVYATKSTGNQTIGLRFTGLTIPEGATIKKSWLQFTTSKKGLSATNLTIKGEKSLNPATYSTVKNSISGRNKTTASVTWIPSGWSINGASGTAQQTPDLTNIVQEIINLSGWASGNSMAFIITGSGTRFAYSYDGSAVRAAQLNVEYEYMGPAMKNGTITVTDGTDCNAVPEIAHTSLICYPVPFSGVLQIDFVSGDNETLKMIELYNASGIMIRKFQSGGNSYTLQGEELPSGFYLVKGYTDKNSYFQRVLKK